MFVKSVPLTTNKISYAFCNVTGHNIYSYYSKGEIIGIGNMGKEPSIIENVLLVDGLKHNFIA